MHMCALQRQKRPVFIHTEWDEQRNELDSAALIKHHTASLPKLISWHLACAGFVNEGIVV